MKFKSMGESKIVGGSKKEEGLNAMGGILQIICVGVEIKGRLVLLA